MENYRARLQALCKEHLPRTDCRRTNVFLFAALKRTGIIPVVVYMNFPNTDVIKPILWNSTPEMFLQLVKHELIGKIANEHVWKEKFMRDLGVDLESEKGHRSYKIEYPEFVNAGNIHKQKLLAYKKGYFGVVRALIQKQIDEIGGEERAMIREYGRELSRNINRVDIDEQIISAGTAFCFSIDSKITRILNSDPTFKSTVISKLNEFKTNKYYPQVYSIVGDCIDKIDKLQF
jgi:hypothetical protein